VDVQSGFDYLLVNQDADLSLADIPTMNFFTHDSFPMLTVGDIISIADDELNLQVMDVTETFVSCKALNSFHLTSNRSISVKNKPFAFFANSDKDMLFVRNLKDVPQNIKLLVSFTKKAADIQKLKSIQPEIEIIPKIETILDEATLLEIMACCQTILLGRGDLSTSSKPNEIFAFQELLIDLCKIHGKKLIIGTGLLAGIGDKQTPSISDVMDYSYLRHMGIDAFLISGSNAHNEPLITLKFIKDFEL
jgi:pyruvate kinase